uniref:Uncharacterized protein n=1 Tax=Pseudomonas phage HRDY3 TaxID=3236930 RepID=A0AB39CDZ7_9VIRU
MDIFENGVLIGHADEPGPVGEPGLPGADWNGGRGGDRGVAGPDPYAGAKSTVPWYVQQAKRQARRAQKGKVR